MPRFEVDVGSSTYQVDAPDPDTAWAWANQYHTQNQPQPQPKESGFFPALKHTVSSSLGELSTGIQSLFGNANEAAAAGAQREAQSNFAPKASLENLVSAFKQGPWTGIKEAASQAPEIIGGAAPSIGEYMGAAGAGSAVAGPVGAILAPAALFGLQHLGGLAEQQAAAQQQQGQPVSVNPKQLAPYALGQTAIDIALGGGAASQLGKSVASKMFGETVANLIAKGDKKAAEALARESVKTALMKGTAVGAAMGVPAGVGQVALERAASDKPLLSDDALKEYAESAYQYGALSPLGGLARLHGVAEAKDTLNKLNQPAPGAPGTQPGALPGESPKDTALRIKAAKDAQEQLAADAKAIKQQQQAEQAKQGLQFPPIEGVEAKAETAAPTQPAGTPVLDTELLNNIGVNKDHPAFDLLKDTDLSTAKGQEKLTDILTANAQMPEASRILDQPAADALQTKLNTFSAPTKFPEIKAPEEPAEVTPPVENGFIRMYHGAAGTAPDTGGGRWLTPHLDYAKGYADKNGNGQVYYVDLPENSPLLKPSFETAGTSVKAPPVHFEAPEELAKQLKPYKESANVPTPNEPANVIRPSGATEVTGTQPEGVRAGVEVAGEPRAGQAPAEPIAPTVGLPEQNAPTRNVAEAGTKGPLKPEINPNAATPEMAGDALGQEVDIKGEKGKITGGYSDGGFEIQRGNVRTGTVPGTALHEDIANQLKQKGIKTPEPTPAPTPQPTVPELPPEAKQLIEGNYEGEAPKAPELQAEDYTGASTYQLVDTRDAYSKMRDGYVQEISNQQADRKVAKLPSEKRALSEKIEQLKTLQKVAEENIQKLNDEIDRRGGVLKQGANETDEVFAKRAAEHNKDIANQNNDEANAEKIKERVNEAVGVFNNPKSDRTRMRLAAEFILGRFKETNKGNLAWDHIRNALKYIYGNYSGDLPPDTRAELFKIFKQPADKVKAEVLRDPAFKDLEFLKDTGGRKPETVPPDHPVNTTVREAVARGDVKGALLNISLHGTEVQSKIARRLIDIFGIHGLPKLTLVDGYGLRDPANVKNLAKGIYDIGDDHVRISSLFQTGHTVLHELVHAASSKLLIAGEERRLQGQAKLGFDQLHNLFKFLQGKEIVNENKHAFLNIREFLAEALSNKDFQESLDKIQYQRPGQSGLRRFWEGFKNLLGFKDSALKEVMRLSDEMLERGRQEQYTENPNLRLQEPLLHTPQMAAEAEASGLMGEKKKPSGFEKYFGSLRGEHAIQNLLVDRLASITAKLNDFYGGKIRDLLGNINPAVLLKKAQDWTRWATQVKYKGMLGFEKGDAVAKKFTVPTLDDVNNPDHYIARMYPDLAGQDVSYVKPLMMAWEESKRTGTPLPEILKTVGHTILMNRFYELRNHNARLDAQIRFLTDRGVSPNHKSIQRLELLKKDPYNGGTVTDAQIDSAHQHFVDNPDIQKISHIWDAVRFKMLDTLVEAGRLSKEQADLLKSNAGYIPFERLGEFGDTVRAELKNAQYDRGVANLKALKKLGSSDRALANPFESFAKFIDWGTKEAMNNFAGIRAAKDLELMGYAKKLDDVDSNAKGVVKLYDNGERVAYSVEDPLLYVAFHALDTPTRGALFKFLQKSSQVLRAGVSMVPAFGWRNAVDDITRNYVYANVENPGQMTLSTLAGFPGLWIKELKGVQDPTVQAMSARGVEATYGFQGGLDLKNILTHLGLEHESLPSKIFHWVEAGAKAADLTSRRAIYAQTIAETKGTPGFPDGDHLLAEHRAREIINFSNRGSSGTMSTLASVIPFFNAYAQGMGKLYNAAVGKAGAMGTPGMSIARAQRMFYTRMATLTALGTAYALLMTKDDNYWNIDNYIRDNNWILPFGDKLGFTPAIPAASELAYFYKAIPERIVQYYMLKGTPDERSAIRMAAEMVSRGIDVFSSPNVALPQLFKPFFENSINYSFFMGRNLESQEQISSKRPYLRFGNSTSEFSKEVANQLEKVYQATGIDWLSVSPIKIDNALRGIFGSTAGVATALTDQILNPNRTDRPLHQMLAAQLTGASAFMKDPIGTRMLDEFYNLSNEVNMANNNYKQLQQTDPTRAGEFYMANRGSIIYYDRVNATKQYIDQLNQQITQLTTSPMFYGLDPAGRRERITELKRMETELAKHVFVLRRDIDKANAWVD